MVEPRLLILDDHVARTIETAVDKTFAFSFQIPTKVNFWNVGQNVPLDFRSLYAAQITLMQQGIPFGVFIAAFNRALLLRVLNLNAVPPDPASIEDAAAEITNMLFGLFKTAVNNDGYSLSMGLPVLLHDKDIAKATFMHWNKLCLCYSAGGEKGWVAVAQYL